MSKVLAICLSVSGCASFEPGARYQDLLRPRQPSVKETREGLEVSIEDFASKEKSAYAFDADIVSYGVLPLLVRIENTTNENYRIQENGIKALLGAQSLTLLYGGQAADQAATSEYSGKAAAWTLATGPFAILLFPLTIGGSAAHTYSVNNRIRQHFINLEFADILLKPKQTAAGFVYFKLPDGVKKLEKLSVVVEVSEEKSGRPLSFSFSLATLDLSTPTP